MRRTYRRDCLVLGVLPSLSEVGKVEKGSRVVSSTNYLRPYYLPVKECFSWNLIHSPRSRTLTKSFTTPPSPDLICYTSFTHQVPGRRDCSGPRTIFTQKSLGWVLDPLNIRASSNFSGRKVNRCVTSTSSVWSL